MNATALTKRSRAETVENDPRWAAVVDRDPAAIGRFVLAVRTTGIYCRPGCPARRPLPENVAFFDTCADAEAAGFRACMRCRPNTAVDSGHAAIISAACRTIETSSEVPTLDALARSAGLSPFHFHRVFKAATGLTPRGYADAHRARRLREGLADEATSVTAAIYDAGYGSSSRFYERSKAMLGMTPTDYRKGGAGTNVHFAVVPCALGTLLVACSRKGVCAITLGDEPEPLVQALKARFPQAKLDGDDPAFQALVTQIVGFVAQPARGLDLPLDVRGTAFQQRVWQALREIPAGMTQSYTEIANRIGAPRAVRAVAQACGANPVAVAIPCHRVVRRDGDLSGYRWGVCRKRALLASEGVKS